MKRILIIKLSAFGDVIMAWGAIEAICHHYHGHSITLMTTKPYVELAKRSGLFDTIYCDKRPKIWQLQKVLQLRGWLRTKKFSHVYDLQTNNRTQFYYRLFGEHKPLWSGIIPKASHYDASPDRKDVHIHKRFSRQLALSGIEMPSTADLSWMKQDISRFNLPKRYALLIPGSSAAHGYKRWPTSSYGVVAKWLVSKDITPVILGGDSEYLLAQELISQCPQALSLVRETNSFEIASLAFKALAFVGNDTGPAHLVAACAKAGVMVYSQASKPWLSKPCNPSITSLIADDISQISAQNVIAKLRACTSL